MDPKALSKAQRRLRVAQSSAAALKNANNYQTFADHWYVFLHSAKGIYTTLEQGAKASPQSRQWFGAKNQARKDDALLRYITEARNDDEHELEESTAVQPSTLNIGISQPGDMRTFTDQYGNTVTNCGTAFRFDNVLPGDPRLPVITATDGRPVKSEFHPAKIVLKAVHDRSKRTYPPPKLHLGKSLTDGGPLEVASLALAYLGTLVEEAEGFCRP